MSIPAVSPEMLRSHRYRGFDRLFDDDEQRFIFFSIHLAPRSGRFLRLQEYFGNYGRNFQNILKRSLRALRLPCPTLYRMDIRDAMNRANIGRGRSSRSEQERNAHRSGLPAPRAKMTTIVIYALEPMCRVPTDGTKSSSSSCMSQKNSQSMQFLYLLANVP